MPLNADGCLVDQTPLSTQSTDIASHAPPLYGEHILDQLYADIDQSGIMTPAPQSGMNTPFYSQSRTGSSENLGSLDSAVDQNGAVPPAALSSRLQNLHNGSRNNSFTRMPPGPNSGGNTPHQAPNNENDPNYFTNAAHPANNSNPDSNPLSRRTSEEEAHHEGISNLASGQHTPEHIDYSDLGDLSKVPSYSTAVKAPIRSSTYSTGLPNYEAAISTPTTPNVTLITPTTPSVESPVGSPNLMRRGVFGIQPPLPIHIGDNDERRRIQILQQRERAH